MYIKKITALFKGQSCNNGGFTLVETLVAITILVLALTGPLAIISQSLKASYFSRDEITAAYLAQEPIEFIRNMRDQNTLRNQFSKSWLKGDYPGTGIIPPYNITKDLNGNNLISPVGAPNSIPVELIWQSSSGSFVLKRCGANNCRVSIDPNASAGGKVVYGSTIASAVDSIYTRTIYLSRSGSDPMTMDPSLDMPDRELVITVIVSWNTGGVSHNVTVTENLFNWQLENEP